VKEGLRVKPIPIPSRSEFVRTCATVAASLAIARPAMAQTASAPPNPIVVGLLPSPDMATILYGRSQGAFTKAGLNLQLQTMQNGADILAAEVGSSVQIGYSDSYTLVQAFQHGIPLKLISPGGLYRSIAPTIKLVVPADSTIKSAKDLVGKTVGGVMKNILGLSMNAWLTREGVDPASVHYLAALPNLAVTALQGHRVDAIVAFEPYLSAAEASGARAIATPFDAIAPAFLASSWFAVAPWVTDHRDVATTFAAIMSRSSAYVNVHYQEMIPMLAEFSKMAPETLAKMGQSQVPSALVPAQLQPVIDAAVRTQYIPSGFKAEDMILSKTLT
jgi:NitT/TauT family transport system substrate-binding protein